MATRTENDRKVGPAVLRRLREDVDDPNRSVGTNENGRPPELDDPVPSNHHHPRLLSTIAGLPRLVAAASSVNRLEMAVAAAVADATPCPEKILCLENPRMGLPIADPGHFLDVVEMGRTAKKDPKAAVLVKHCSVTMSNPASPDPCLVLARARPMITAKALAITWNDNNPNENPLTTKRIVIRLGPILREAAKSCTRLHRGCGPKSKMLPPIQPPEMPLTIPSRRRIRIRWVSCSSNTKIPTTMERAAARPSK